MRLLADSNRLQLIIAVCALVTSAIAVFVAWDQARVLRAQQHGAVYPVLQVDGFVSTERSFVEIGLRFRNSGVGPALIEAIDVERNGEKLADLLEPYAELPGAPELSWTSMTGRAIAPGDEVEALRFSWPRGQISAEELAAAQTEWGSLKLSTCYCSVFERCWRMPDMGTSRAERVKACTRSDTDLFSDLAARRPEKVVEIPETPAQDEQE